VWNPQTSILKYEQEAVEQYGKTCFGCEELEDLQTALDGRVISDVASAYLHAENTVIYLQNARDWHTEAHLQPFLSKLGMALPVSTYSGWLAQGLYLHLENFSDGHNPPPRHVIARLLHALSGSDARELDIQYLLEGSTSLDEEVASINLA